MKPQTPLQPEFAFAGFTWPRYVADMACGPAHLRNKWLRQRKITGGYFHAPTPNSNTGRSFYLADAGQPSPRWEWASDDAFYCDEEGDQTIRGIILRLPHGRFLAGWAMGEHMAAGCDATLYTDEDDARHAADEAARVVAEAERDYQAHQRAEEDAYERD